jgi:AcrR family transcriptional regulator
MGDENSALDAALRCVARWGVAKTTLDDVAREAGVSRATLYREFRGGKATLLVALRDRELARMVSTVDEALAGAGTLEDLLVAGLTTAARVTREHEAFQFLLAHEPDVVLPFFAFHHIDRLFSLATSFARPHLERFLPPDGAAWAAEFAVRLVVTYTLAPSPVVDLSSESDARRLVRTYVLPGCAAETVQRSNR